MSELLYFLKKSKVLRGGSSHSRMQVEKTTLLISSDDDDDCISFIFSVAVPGGGQTDIRVEVGSEDFRHLLEVMSAVNPRHAAPLYASELNRILSAGTESPEKSED